MENKAMKTNFVQQTSGQISDKRNSQASKGKQGIQTVGPPDQHINWLSSYDEEWIAFVNEHSIHKLRPGINNIEPVPLPRVWNCPHF